MKKRKKIMKLRKDTILFMLLAANTSIVYCDEGFPSEHVLMNGRIVPVFANVTRSHGPSESWDQVNMRVRNYDFDPVDETAIGKRANIMSRHFRFAPKEGVYEKTKVIYERLCTISDPDNEVESVKSIVDVDAANGTFISRSTSQDNPDLVFDVPCEFHGRVYRCDVPTQEIDFAFVGLDAVLTIEGSSYGIWKGGKRHINIPGQTFSCIGTDCGVEPASTLFGTLSELMPCSSLAIYEYKWQSDSQ
jgi:hypothetical protein